MSRPILNLQSVELESFPYPGPAERFGARMGPIAPRIGAKMLGCNLTEIQPGKSAFPFHNHWVNEELFLVLEGEGEVRIGAERHPLRQGDVLSCPPGGPETAHQIVNTSDRPMRIFAVSTKIPADLCEYPDSGKVGVLARRTDANGQEAHFRFVSRPNLGVDYWDGE